MGDAENTLPPSKKRAAGRELSRDNPGLDDEEEDISEQESGTFKRASEEVLANRRIVKVRCNQTPSAPSAPSSNPFASICLVPPKDSTAAQETVKTVREESQDNVKTETERKEDGDNQQPESKIDQETVKTACEESQDNVKTENEKEEDVDNQQPESKIDQETAKTACEESQENVKTETGKEEDGDNRQPKNKIDEAEAGKNADEEKHEDVKKESADAEAAKGDEKQDALEKNTETASVSSFRQLSSSQNAFTGLVGTGFSSSMFSFGSITKTDKPTFPSFSFGTNGNPSIFGNPGASVTDKTNTNGTKIPSTQQTHIETGEENEKTVFTAHSVLFEFLDGVWKERGKGELRVNISTTGTGKARLVMRARGNYRLILNASLFPDMKLTNMEKKGITFACLNSTGEEKEKDSFSTFALKFKDASVVEEFLAVVTQHKGDTSAPTASDE